MKSSKNLIVNIKDVDLNIPIITYESVSLRRSLFKINTNRSKNNLNLNSLEIFKKLNLKFYQSDRVGLYGHNGAGKTTLLRLVAGILKPTYGSILVNGSISSFLDISMGVNLDATGIDNIKIRGALLGISKKYIDDKLEDIINFSELGDFANLPCKTYSTGMLMRLYFSLSTFFHADIYLMDEWLSVGDEVFNQKASKQLKSLLNDASLVIMASHNKELLKSFCNRILILDKGTIKEIDINNFK